MYTRCPECETVFQIEIDELKAAEGRVCCGECDRVFNALVSLTDTPEGDLPGGPAGHSEETPEDTGGPQAEEQAPEVGDLFEALAESKEEEDSGAATWAPDATLEPPADDRSPEQLQWEQKLAELGLVGEYDSAPSEQAAADADADAATEEIIEDSDPADWLRVQPLERRNWPWALAAIVAGLALVAQTIHYWREDLARTPVFDPWLAQFYRAAGKPLPEHWDVSAYLVKKGAVSDHPDIAGTLLVNAVIGNVSRRPMPFPLLKVTLLDRWGEAIGERFFAPGEYLQAPGDARTFITQDDLVEASVLIVDPGQGAVSYGIDVCLRDAGNRLSCAHQDGF